MKIYLYDTTLRDGCQGEGISFSLEDKLKVATKLDWLGIDYIEGGWPGSNPKDKEFFRRARRQRWQGRLCAFGSTRRPNLAAEQDKNLRAIVEAGVPVATIVGKSWDFHVLTALETSLAENLAMIRQSIAFLKGYGLEVVYDAEHFFDGYHANADYALATVRAAAEAGADWVVLCDTNGGSLPHEVEEIVHQVKKVLPVRLGVHTHNDSAVAVANALAAVRAGVEQVQGTVNGLGERCGNADLCAIIPNLQLKMGHCCLSEEQLARLTEVSRYVNEIANLVPQANQPFVGQGAFAHKAGVHVSAILKHDGTYEHISPEKVGNRRRVLVSELAGTSNIVYKARELGLDIEPSAEGRRLIELVKELEHKGYQYEGAEASLELLMRRALGLYRPAFVLETLQVLVEKRAQDLSVSVAVIKVRVGNQVVHTAAEGNGPVNALDNALRKALESFYPVLKGMRLTDYKVRVLDEKDGTGAKVRVLIESQDAEGSWSTVGVSENIIEASWQALVDSMDYALLKRQKTAAKDARVAGEEG
ncbi:MAG: citramalate synthase [Clostridia bacterium]|nr:citramalate synthase [Clostridia bacterium]